METAVESSHLLRRGCPMRAEKKLRVQSDLSVLVLTTLVSAYCILSFSHDHLPFIIFQLNLVS